MIRLDSKKLKKLSLDFYQSITSAINKDKTPNKRRNIEGRMLNIYQKQPCGSNKDFVNRFVERDFRLLKLVCTAKPKDLELLIKVIENEKEIKGIDEASDFWQSFIDVFNYDTFRSNENGKKMARSIVDTFNFKTCPYCNKEVIDEKEDGTLFFSLDHFYSQSNYPYLSLSFYNMILSCTKCNSSIKLSQEFNFKEQYHPYVNSLHKLFRFDFTKYLIGKYDVESVYKTEIDLDHKFCDDHIIKFMIKSRYSSDYESVIYRWERVLDCINNIENLKKFPVIGKEYNDNTKIQNELIRVLKPPIDKENILGMRYGKVVYDMAEFLLEKDRFS